MDSPDSPPFETDDSKADSSPGTPHRALVVSASRPKRRRPTGVPGECCRTCRLRKVKCTGNPGDGPCAHCSRLELGCSFTQTPRVSSAGTEEKVLRTTPSQSHTEAGTPRRRAQRACGECHLHKTKCSGDLPRCKRCRSNDLPCVYTAARRNFSITPASEHSNPDDGQALLSVAMGVPSSAASIDSTDGSFTSYPPHEPMDGLAADILFKKDLLLRHLDVYFEYFHPLSCYGFLHPATTYREVDLHRFSPYLATAVCAVTATILDPEAGPSFAAQCNEEVEIYLWRNMKRLDIEVLRLVCLCIMYNWSQGQAAKCWMYQAFAVRLVKGLRLNWEANRPCAEQEATRRLVWLVFNMDKQLAGGLDDHLDLPQERMQLNLPCSEQAFRDETPVQMSRLDKKCGSPRAERYFAPAAFHCRMMALRHEILGFSRHITASSDCSRRPTLETTHLIRDFGRLQTQLTSLSESLPSAYKRLDSNSLKHLGTTEWPSFVLTHTWLSQLHMELNRFSVPGTRDQAAADVRARLPADFVRKAAEEAIGWAISLAQFWASLRRLLADRPPGSAAARLLAADLALATCGVQSCRVLTAARQAALYPRLQSRCTAPLHSETVVGEATYAALVESNVAVLQDLAVYLPHASHICKGLHTLLDHDDGRAADALQERLAGLSPAKPPGPNSHLAAGHALPADANDDEQPNFLVGLWIGDSGGVLPPGPAARPPVDYPFPRPDLSFPSYAERSLVPEPAATAPPPLPPPLAGSPLEAAPVPGYGLVGHHQDSFAAAPLALGPPPPVSHMVPVPISAYSMQYYGDVYHPQPVPQENGYFHAVHRSFGG